MNEEHTGQGFLSSCFPVILNAVKDLKCERSFISPFGNHRLIALGYVANLGNDFCVQWEIQIHA